MLCAVSTRLMGSVIARKISYDPVCSPIGRLVGPSVIISLLFFLIMITVLTLLLCKCMHLTVLVWPYSVCWHEPVSAFQTFRVLIWLHLIIGSVASLCTLMSVCCLIGWSVIVRSVCHDFLSVHYLYELRTGSDSKTLTKSEVRMPWVTETYRLKDIYIDR